MWRRAVVAVATVAVAVATAMVASVAAVLVVGSPASHAQQPESGFVALSEVVAQAASAGAPGQMLFFPLDDSFEGCVPVQAACPQDSSTLMLVPAVDRRLTWRPEGGDLHLVDLDAPPVRAMGAAPSRPEEVRYLVPVLEGSGIGLFHMPRRLVGGRLVIEADAPATGADLGATPADAVTPVLGGSLLSTASPAPAPERLLEAPVVVAGSDLVDAAPAMLVRRSAPSRIVFGVRPDPDWGLDISYVPLLDEDVVALGGRHGGRVGLAVTVPPGLDEEALARLEPADAVAAPERGQQPRWWLIAGAAAVVAAAAIAVAARARRRRTAGDLDRP